MVKVINEKGESHLIEPSQLEHFAKFGFVEEGKKVIKK